MAFLIEQVKDKRLADPGDPQYGVGPRVLAMRYVETCPRYRPNRTSAGSLDIASLHP